MNLLNPDAPIKETTPDDISFSDWDAKRLAEYKNRRANEEFFEIEELFDLLDGMG